MRHFILRKAEQLRSFSKVKFSFTSIKYYFIKRILFYINFITLICMTSHLRVAAQKITNSGAQIYANVVGAPRRSLMCKRRAALFSETKSADEFVNPLICSRLLALELSRALIARNIERTYVHMSRIDVCVNGVHESHTWSPSPSSLTLWSTNQYRFVPANHAPCSYRALAILSAPSFRSADFPEETISSEAWLRENRRRMSDYAPRVKIRGYANAITSGDIDMRDEREGHNFLTIIIFWIATLDNNLDKFF